MKRILTVILCIAMMTVAAAASAAELTLPTKLERQMQHDGNGEKGNLTITANANPDEYPLISAIQNAEYSILRNASGDQWHVVFFQNEKDEAGNELRQFNKTELYRNKNCLYFRSDFLPNEVFQIPEEISMILPEKMISGENPSLNSVFISLMKNDETNRQKKEKAIEKYSRILDKWIDSFQGIPEQIRSDDGTILMKIQCIVPAEDVCRKIADLVISAAADPELSDVFSRLMTDEQKAIYLNPNLGYYYLEALSGAAITGDIQYTRINTALGQTVSKELTLPLNPEITGYETLKIKNSVETLSWTLQGNKSIIQIILPENIETILDAAEFQFGDRYIKVNLDEQNEDKNLAVAIQIRKKSEISFDAEKEKNHEIITYTTDICRDTSSLPDGIADADIDPFDDLKAELTLHYSGKTGPNAATTLEVSMNLAQGTLKLNANGKIKTTSTWPFVPFSTENAIQLNRLSENEKSDAIVKLLKNASKDIVRISTLKENE